MDENAPTISVIIPHLNQHEAVLRCLASVCAQRYPADRMDIILADNGSAGNLSSVRRAFPHIRMVREERPGPGLARNAGVAVAQGDILAFVDADCRAHPLWLRAAATALTQPGSSGVVGGDVRIDLADPDHLTGLEAYESVFAYRQALYIRKMHFSGTGNLAMWRTVYDAVGPFGGIEIAEDRDWGRRALLKGYRTLYAPNMIVFHPARTDLADMEAKWRRQTAHDLADHRAANRPGVFWLARIAAVIGVTPLHALRLLFSPRVPSLSARMRGMATLLAIRALRVRQMLLQWVRREERVAQDWNRAR